MSGELAKTPGAAAAQQAGNDEQVMAMWVHGKSPNTQRAYSYHIWSFFSFVRKPLALITLADLQAFSDSLTDLKPSSRNTCLGAVRSLLTFAHKIGYIPFNAGAVMSLEKVRDGLADHILPESAVQRMIYMEPDYRNRVVIRTLYYLGLRVSELCALRWQDVQAHKESGVVTVFGKGGKTRTIRAPRELWGDFLALQADAPGLEQVVFVSRKGSPLSPEQVWRIVRAAAKRAGIDRNVSPHWLRHCHASHALERKAPVHVVQATLGHASLSTTSRYVHARPEESSGDYLAG